MSAKLPYLASPGNVPKTLDAIKRAATPPRISQDFVKSKLGIPGSSGDQMASFLKRLGFASSDGSPTELYKAYRTGSGGTALAKAVRHAYGELYELNEYMHECDESEIKDLIIQVTGMEANARPVGLIYTTLRNLLDASNFDEVPDERIVETNEEPTRPPTGPQNLSNLSGLSEQSFGLNIGYTINLNLPETTNIEVFNAIFKSLKEHLLRNDDV